jgi:hypothetical protein
MQRRHPLTVNFLLSVYRSRRRTTAFTVYYAHDTHVATRKNITIRDDQEEWIQDNHLNLSSFIQEKLDELIEERV